MSKTTDALRERGVYNPYEFYGDIAHLWYAAREARSVRPNGWYVSERGVDLNDGKGHWNDQGRRFFSGRKRDALEPALAWARGHYRIEEWKRDPFGGYGPAEFVNARLKELLR